MNEKKRKSRGRIKESRFRLKHYIDPLKNLRDGVDSDRRIRNVPAGRQTGAGVPHIKGADEMNEFLGELAAAGGEKFPGLGTIIIADVGRHGGKRTVTRLINPEKMMRRAAALDRAVYYQQKRADRKNGIRRIHPGIALDTITTKPPYDRALRRAVSDGAIAPDDFLEFLAAKFWDLEPIFEQATRYTAVRGCALEFVIVHLQQGAIHLHLIFRDRSLRDHSNVGSQLGLFPGGVRPRLAMVNLGNAGIAQRRWRNDALAPVPAMIRARTRRGITIERHIVEGWEELEDALDRVKRETGQERSADMILADWWDRVLGEEALRRFNALKQYIAEEEATEHKLHLQRIAIARKSLGLTAAEESERAKDSERRARMKCESETKLRKESDEMRSLAEQRAVEAERRSEVARLVAEGSKEGAASYHRLLNEMQRHYGTLLKRLEVEKFGELERLNGSDQASVMRLAAKWRTRLPAIRKSVQRVIAGRDPLPGHEAWFELQDGQQHFCEWVFSANVRLMIGFLAKNCVAEPAFRELIDFATPLDWMMPAPEQLRMATTAFSKLSTGERLTAMQLSDARLDYVAMSSIYIARKVSEWRKSKPVSELDLSFIDLNNVIQSVVTCEMRLIKERKSQPDREGSSQSIRKM